MRIEHTRSSRRVETETRLASSSPYRRMTEDQKRSAALALRSSSPRGLTCEFCGGPISGLGAASRNDSPDWPHPPVKVSRLIARAVWEPPGHARSIAVQASVDAAGV